jgi:hypothetical protein
LTVRRIPSSIWRITLALLSPVIAQNLATEKVTGDKGALGARGRRGLAIISKNPCGRSASKVARFPQLTVNSLLNLAGGHTLESRFGFAGRDSFVDPKLPPPQVVINLHEGKLHAPAVHDLGGGDASFASSSANSFRSTSRVRLSVVSASRLL